MPRKTALITGVTGQDGSYLTDFLLAKGYKIIGVKRRSSSFNTKESIIFIMILDNQKTLFLFMAI